MMDSNQWILIKLFISGLMSYILGIVYQTFLTKKSIQQKHLFNLSLGLIICYFNFGQDTIHSLITCLTIYCSIRLFDATITMVIINFLFTMSYLLYGYYQKYLNQTTTTDITWTMPQCVLTLSLISISFDIYDGKNNLKHNDKKINEDTAIERLPTLLELLSKIYFPPSFLIGPQIRFKDYLNFIESDHGSILKLCWKASLLRFMSGIVYLLFYQMGNNYWPIKYFQTDNFKSHGFLMKILIITIANKLLLYKYIGSWLISEGSCIMYGISYDNENKLDNNKCCNVNIVHYETTATFRGLVESFNITTNQFAMKYIFKRLKFLQSKLLSHLLTLLFLAIWHGFSIGYYNTFLLEFIIMKMETDIANQVIEYRTRFNRFNQLLNNTTIRWFIYLLMRLHVTIMLSYSLVSFTQLDFQQWNIVYSQCYYFGHVIYLSLFILYPLLFNQFIIQMRSLK